MDKDKKSDIQALLEGDENTIRKLYSILFPKVRKFILKNKGSVSDAEEIFHNALFQLIVRSKTKEITISSSLDAYIFTICKNLWYKELNIRKKKVRTNDIFELQSKEDYHIESILQQERWDLFEEMFQKLSDNCKKLLKDFFNNVSYDILIKKFNYANKNVAFQRIFKCKRKLTNLIKSDERYTKL